MADRPAFDRRRRVRATGPAQADRLPGEGRASPADSITTLDDVPAGRSTGHGLRTDTAVRHEHAQIGNCRVRLRERVKRTYREPVRLNSGFIARGHVSARSATRGGLRVGECG